MHRYKAQTQMHAQMQTDTLRRPSASPLKRYRSLHVSECTMPSCPRRTRTRAGSSSPRSHTLIVLSDPDVNRRLSNAARHHTGPECAPNVPMHWKWNGMARFPCVSKTSCGWANMPRTRAPAVENDERPTARGPAACGDTPLRCR